MPEEVFYKKIVEGDKITFYSEYFQSFWAYEQTVGYKTLAFLGFIGTFILVLIFNLIQVDLSQYSRNSIEALLIVFMLFVLLWWMYIILKGAVDAKSFFFEITVTNQKISLYTPKVQWTYKITDIKKIVEKEHHSEDEYYRPIFFIYIESEVKEIELIPSQILGCHLFQLIKDICQHTGIRLEDEFGNLVKV